MCGRSPGSLGTSPFLKHKHTIHLKEHSFRLFHCCHKKCFPLLFLTHLVIMPLGSPTFSGLLQDPQSFPCPMPPRPHLLVLYLQSVPLGRGQAFPTVPPFLCSSSLLLTPSPHFPSSPPFPPFLLLTASLQLLLPLTDHLLHGSETVITHVYLP